MTGYDEEVREVSRITDQFHPLESKKKEEINQKLCVLQKIQYKHPLISIYYFVPDKRKVGGSYTEMYGRLKNIDLIEKCLNMKNGEKIPMKYVMDLQGDEFTDITF